MDWARTYEVEDEVGVVRGIANGRGEVCMSSTCILDAEATLVALAM